MYIKNKLLTLIFRIIIVFISFLGIYLNFASLKHFSLLPLISYFTILSNIFCFLFYLTMVIKTISNYKNYEDKNGTFLKGTMILCVTVTLLIFHIILKDSSFIMINNDYLRSWPNIIVHYLVPILTLIEWLVFNKKNHLRYVDAFKWLIIPTIYLIIIIINGLNGYTYPGGSNYPYFFLDINKFGLVVVIRNILIIGVIFLFLGFSSVFLDRNISKIRIKRKNEKSN